MKVTLCYPALVPGHKAKYGLQTLGILYIAALLRREGFDVAVIDAERDNEALHSEISRLGEENLQLREALVASGRLQRIAEMRERY